MRNIILGLAFLASVSGAGCVAAFAEHGPDSHLGSRYATAYEIGFRNGYRDGAWAGHRDAGKRYRGSFWDDGRYRRAEEGYRVHFGEKREYAYGFREGYEQGYFDRRMREWRETRRDDRRFHDHRHPGQSVWCRERH
jgi:hypothetical protein